MSSHDDDRDLLEQDRLLLRGSEAEKSLLRSARLDGPPSGARGRLSEALFRAPRRGGLRALAEQLAHPRSLFIGLGAAIACAAAVSLFSSRARSPAPPPDLGTRLTADPVTSAQRAPARDAPPSPLAASPDLANCVDPVVAEGSTPLIDDFEDRNARLASNEGRSGAWMVYNDGTGVQTPPHGGVWHPVAIPGGRGPSRYALHTWGSAFKGWGITGGFGLAAPHCYDAAAYDGVKFWVKGTGRILFTAKMTQVVAVEDGGSCRKGCYDVHRASIELTKRWTEHTVRWVDLAQQGSGTAIAFDPKSLYAMGFFASGEDTPFDFWIDDVAFVTR